MITGICRLEAWSPFQKPSYIIASGGSRGGLEWVSLPNSKIYPLRITKCSLNSVTKLIGVAPCPSIIAIKYYLFHLEHYFGPSSLPSTKMTREPRYNPTCLRWNASVHLRKFSARNQKRSSGAWPSLIFTDIWLAYSPTLGLIDLRLSNAVIARSYNKDGYI